MRPQQSFKYTPTARNPPAQVEPTSFPASLLLAFEPSSRLNSPDLVAGDARADGRSRRCSSTAAGSVRPGPGWHLFFILGENINIDFTFTAVVKCCIKGNCLTSNSLLRSLWLQLCLPRPRRRSRSRCLASGCSRSSSACSPTSPARSPACCLRSTTLSLSTCLRTRTLSRARWIPEKWELISTWFFHFLFNSLGWGSSCCAAGPPGQGGEEVGRRFGAKIHPNVQIQGCTAATIHLFT